MTNWSEFLQKILDERRITAYNLSKQANINTSTIYSLLDGKNKKPTPKIIHDIEKALDIKITEDDNGKIQHENFHWPTSKQEEIQRLLKNNPIWAEWFIKFDDENKVKISYQIYQAPEIEEEFYQAIKENFTIKSPFSIFAKENKQVTEEVKYPERQEPHNNKIASVGESTNIYEKQQEILYRIESIESQLKEKDKRIEELEAAVQVLGAKLGITGTLVQILEAVKSGRLS